MNCSEIDFKFVNTKYHTNYDLKYFLKHNLSKKIIIYVFRL